MTSFNEHDGQWVAAHCAISPTPPKDKLARLHTAVWVHFRELIFSFDLDIAKPCLKNSKQQDDGHQDFPGIFNKREKNC